MQEIIHNTACNGVGRGPSGTTWGPKWLSPESLPAVELPPAEEVQAADPIPATAEPLNEFEPELESDTIAIDIPPACSCGSLMFWWDARDARHCMNCEPMGRSRRLMDWAERLRRQPKRR